GRKSRRITTTTVRVTMSFDYVHDPIVGEILSYWQRLSAGRTMPSRGDIKPRDIQRQLRNIQLIEVVNGGDRFRCRFLRTQLTQMFGYDFTGLYHDEVFKGERLNSLQIMYREVCATKKPVFARTKFATAKGYDVYTNRLYLPLSDDGENVNMIL